MPPSFLLSVSRSCTQVHYDARIRHGQVSSQEYRRLLSPQKFIDQALLKSQFAQGQGETASSVDDDNSPLVFSTIMAFVKTVPRWVGVWEFTKLFCETWL